MKERPRVVFPRDLRAEVVPRTVRARGTNRPGRKSRAQLSDPQAIEDATREDLAYVVARANVGDRVRVARAQALEPTMRVACGHQRRADVVGPLHDLDRLAGFYTREHRTKIRDECFGVPLADERERAEQMVGT